jgi:hypothetical protein
MGGVENLEYIMHPKKNERESADKMSRGELIFTSHLAERKVYETASSASSATCRQRASEGGR